MNYVNITLIQGPGQLTGNVRTSFVRMPIGIIGSFRFQNSLGLLQKYKFFLLQRGRTTKKVFRPFRTTKVVLPLFLRENLFHPIKVHFHLRLSKRDIHATYTFSPTFFGKLCFRVPRKSSRIGPSRSVMPLSAQKYIIYAS